jgi:hypothetical protein
MLKLIVSHEKETSRGGEVASDDEKGLRGVL